MPRSWFSDWAGLLWRGVYYTLLASVGVIAFATPYAANVSAQAVIGFTLLALSIYLGWFLVWLFKLWPEPPFAHIKNELAAKSFDVIDRTAIFVSSNLFFVWLPPIKATFPKAFGFWADPYLIAFDRALLGQDAWKLSHLVFGPLTRTIDYLYNVWIVVIIGVSLGVALFASERRMSRYFIGLALTWTIMGIVLAGALASAGPIFGPELGFGFHDLRASLKDAPLTLFGEGILWNAYSTGQLRVGAGISAAPSVHCALTFVMCLTAYRTRWFIPAVAYATFIWVGSVHLGWHYFADGLISLIGVVLLWPVVMFITRSLAWRAPHTSATPTPSFLRPRPSVAFQPMLRRPKL